jgi:hypothetical protein
MNRISVNDVNIVIRVHVVLWIEFDELNYQQLHLKEDSTVTFLKRFWRSPQK